MRGALAELMPAVVRRVAWSGDARRGSVRMELGEGALAGATLIVHAEGGRVQVGLDTPVGVDAEAWRDRLSARLEARGLDVESLEVR